MSHFFADWDYTSHPHVLRMDTRIFWSSGLHGKSGRCIGTFIGENPGSAEGERRFSGWDGLVSGKLPGDPTLRCLLAAWKEAVKLKTASCRYVEEPKSDDYMEVLNTYYFRSPKSMALLGCWRNCGGASLYFQLPNATSRFVILGWGQKMNSQPEAASIGSGIFCQPILTADCQGRVRPALNPPQPFPLIAYPAQPSGIAQHGCKVAFINNLATALYPFV